MKLPFIEKTFLSANKSFESSQIVILGCPYDGSASFRSGARFGPSSIRRASWGIETFSPYFQSDLCRLKIHDMGDLELPQGEKEMTFELIRRCLRKILSKKKFPILLGGDHLITLPAVEEIFKNQSDLHVLQIDAHADLREEYLGETHSHSTVMRRVIDCLGEGRLFQLGIRSGTEEEFNLAKRIGSIIPSNQTSFRSLFKRLRGKPIYISLDLDVIDPALLPGVGTPEPGGLSFQELIRLIKELQKLHIIGFDIVELTPDYDPTQVSSLTASVILREMILAFCFRYILL